MKLSAFKKVKEAINGFNDTEFVSLLSDDKAIVKNINTDREYILPFSINESDESRVSFYPSKSELYSEDEKEGTETLEEHLESETDPKEDFKNAYLEYLNGNFESEDDKVFARDMIVESFMKVIKSDRKKNQHEIVSESETETNDTYPRIVNHFAESEHGKRYIESMSKIYDKLHSYFEMKSEWEDSCGNLFSESGEIKNTDITINPFTFVSLYKEKTKVRHDLFGDRDSYANFFESIKNRFEDYNEDTIIQIFEDANFDSESALRASIAKNIVLFNKSNDNQINVKDFLPIVSEEFNNHFSEKTEPTKTEAYLENLFSEIGGEIGDPNFSDKCKFLKIRTGVYSIEDVRDIRNELSALMRSPNEFSRDELLMIGEARDLIDFMYRTRKIDDEVVSESINRINTAFGIDSVLKQNREALINHASGSSNIKVMPEPKDEPAEITSEGVDEDRIKKAVDDAKKRLFSGK